MTGRLGPLAHRNFQLLLGCDVISMLGTSIANIAIPFAVIDGGGSASDVGYVTVAALIPIIAFLLFGGVVADRLPRQHVMFVANIVQALIQASFGVFVLSGRATLWLMIAFNAVRGSAFGFYTPAAQGVLPQIVSADQLARANALRRMGINSAQIAGAALGGMLISAFGPGWGLVADAIGFLIAAALRIGMHFMPAPPIDGVSVISQLRHGWRAFTSRRWLWVIVTQFGIVNAIFVGCVIVLGPVVAAHSLGGARNWGTILAVQSAGAIAGAGIMIGFRPRRLLLVASLAVPLQIPILIALAVPLPVALITFASLLAGIGIEIFEVNWSTAMQEQVPADLLSRVSAYDALGSYALSPVGTALVGPLSHELGISTVLLGGSIIIAVSTIAVISVPDVWNLRRHEDVAK